MRHGWRRGPDMPNILRSYGDACPTHACTCHALGKPHGSELLLPRTSTTSNPDNHTRAAVCHLGGSLPHGLGCTCHKETPATTRPCSDLMTNLCPLTADAAPTPRLPGGSPTPDKRKKLWRVIGKRQRGNAGGQCISQLPPLQAHRCKPAEPAAWAPRGRWPGCAHSGQQDAGPWELTHRSSMR